MLKQEFQLAECSVDEVIQTLSYMFWMFHEYPWPQILSTKYDLKAPRLRLAQLGSLYEDDVT